MPAVWQSSDESSPQRPGAVEAALAGRRQTEALVVVESVYSVFGDTADLPCLLDLCVRYDALLLVDEAHGIGVTGAETAVGMGAAAAVSEFRDRLVVTATLSKALGSQGGAVLGAGLVRDVVVNTARTFIFDTGLSPAMAAAARAALDLVTAERVASMKAARSQLAAVLDVPVPAGACCPFPCRVRSQASGRANCCARRGSSSAVSALLRCPTASRVCG